jgi:hypothetical protein
MTIKEPDRTGNRGVDQAAHSRGDRGVTRDGLKPRILALDLPNRGICWYVLLPYRGRLGVRAVENSWAAACDWVRCWYGDPGGCWSLPGLARPAAVPRRNVRAPNVRNCDPRPVPGT